MKSCTDKDMKALLPDYREKGNDHPERERIEKHLEACEDCRTELVLLRAMAEEPVPDPGDAFWAAMPDRIHRQVLQQKETGQHRAITSVLHGFLVARWAWASAAAVMLAVVSVLVLRPAPLEKTPRMATSGDASIEDTFPEGPIDVDDFGRRELSAADAWTAAQLSALDAEMNDSVFVRNNDTLDDELDRLDAAQLDRLSKMLNKQKREV